VSTARQFDPLAALGCHAGVSIHVPRTRCASSWKVRIHLICVRGFWRTRHMARSRMVMNTSITWRMLVW